MELKFGALNLSLEYQLRGKVPRPQAIQFERERRAVLLLYINGYMGERAKEKAFNQLVKRIEENII